MVYNLTAITTGNETGLLNMVVGINNNLMFGFLGDLFLIGFAIILFMSFYMATNDISKSTMGTFMIIFIISISMVALGLVHTMTPFIAGTFLVLGVVFSYSQK